MLAVVGQAGCADPGHIDWALVADAAFPANVPGLPADRSWTSLPVATWVVEKDWAVQAISACLPPGCAPEAAVALLRARGPAAVELEAALRDPARLRRSLVDKFGRRRPGARPDLPERRAFVTVQPHVEAGVRGAAIGIARQDGTRGGFGVVLARPGPRGTSVVLTIAADQEVASRLARGVAPHLE